MPRDAAARAARDARRLLRPLRAETLALAQALVRVDTVAIPPDGHETAGPEAARVAPSAATGSTSSSTTRGFLERSRHPFVRRDRKLPRPSQPRRARRRGRAAAGACS